MFGLLHENQNLLFISNNIQNILYSNLQEDNLKKEIFQKLGLIIYAKYFRLVIVLP
jgi:hypothetical protein